MVDSRTATAVAGLAASLLVSAALWWYFETALFFLFVPFVPFLFGRGGRDDASVTRPVRECPECGFRTADRKYQYCPRDGTRLE